MSVPNSPQATDSLQRQVVVLEERLAFQQHLLDQLNAVVLEQRGDIDRLARELAGLRDSVDKFGGGDNLPYEKPPHY